MIEFYHVSKIYDGDEALRDISVKISQGELVVLLGASGTGKSTFLKLIAFEERPTSGEVVVGGVRSTSAGAARVQELRRTLGRIHQDFKLLFDRTVLENVALPLRVAGVPGRDLPLRCEEALERVGLARHGGKRPAQLSGGQQQRVAVARAIVHRPAILLADEPTGNLDTDTSHAVVNVFRELKAQGTAVVLATYDLTLIQPGDRVMHLEHGRLREGQS